MESSSLKFPANPTHGTIFELAKGLLYQYDASLNSWVELVSGDINLPVATTIKPGAMSSADLRKLNRLVLPPPQSTIQGNDCTAPFKSGTLGLKSGDDFVNVEGNINVGNIDALGETIGQSFPFHIHQHTYGFNFSLNLPELIDELESRGQFNITGEVGDQGPQGDTGDKGPDGILAGPAGIQGEQGTAPECLLRIEPDPVPIEARTGLEKALVAVRVVPDPNDEMQYSLEFDRQNVGLSESVATRFNVRQQRSTWVLAVASTTGGQQPLFYLDIEPIIEIIRNKFLSEVDLLKQGYEDIVKFWVQTMSDLFDEQKRSLCCALEFCQSKTKNTSVREHIESVAAAAVGTAKVNLHGRGTDQSSEISGGHLLGEVDPCQDDDDPNFPEPSDRVKQEFGDERAEVIAASAPYTIIIDPTLHTGSATNGVKLNLEAGEYVVTIDKMQAQIDGQHYNPLAIQHKASGKFRTTRFLDKGKFSALVDAKSAYEGLTSSFNHDGGEVSFYFKMLPSRHTSGSVALSIRKARPQPEPEEDDASIKSQPAPDVKPPIHKQSKQRLNKPQQLSQNASNRCRMAINKLSWYQRGWDNEKCCGCVVNVSGQDYIIIKRSVGDDRSCGGGESYDTPCIAKFRQSHGHPAIAWPTLDGKSFMALPSDEGVTFQFDPLLNNIVAEKIANEEYTMPKGNPNGVRHLSFQLTTVLFPAK